jgi:type VI secretion system secreted protein VgrG
MSVIPEQDTKNLATIVTPLGDDVALHAMGGIEGISRPFVYEVDVVSHRADIKASELLGKSVTVQLATEDEENDVRHWNGLVTAFMYVDTSDDGDSRYKLTVRPWLWQLGLSADCRIFQSLSIPEIVAQIFKDRGFDDFELSLSSQYKTQDYVVQFRETDLEFASRLLEREGIYYFFRHEDGKHTLVLADSPSAHKEAPGASTLMYASENAHRDATIRYVRKWKAEARLETGVYAQGDFDFTKPRVQLFKQDSAPDDPAAAKLEVYDFPGGFDNFDDADVYTRLRLEQARRDALRWIGDTNARGFSVGATFDLTDHPREGENQKYLVTFARYRVKGQDSRSTTDDVDPFAAAFVAIPAAVTFRPPLVTRKPVVRGPQTAVVVGPAGKEIWTDAYGRVKVQFPWDRVGKNDEKSSCWIRVSQAWAGSSFGALFTPRVGHEVIVDFLEGDPDRPIITGRVYNGSNLPPFDLPDNQTQSGVTTRSTPHGTLSNGNEIRFEDLKGHEDLYVQAERTQTTLVKASQSIRVGHDRSRAVGNNEAIDIGVDQTFNVGGNRWHTVAKDETVDVGADRYVKVGNDYVLRTKDGIVLLAHGDSGVQIAKGEDTTIVTKNASILVSQTGNVKITNAGGTIMMLKDGTMFLENTSGALTISQVDNEIALTDGKISIQAKSEVEVTSKGKITIHGDDKVEVTAKEVDITGTTEVKIGVGGSSIDLTSSGATVTATMIKLNS